MSLELAGKSPFVVFADADMDRAVEMAVEQYDNAGQVCLAGTRLLVEESAVEEFTAAFIPRAPETQDSVVRVATGVTTSKPM